jgi:hypothetical protein
VIDVINGQINTRCANAIRQLITREHIGSLEMPRDEAKATIHIIACVSTYKK